MQHTPPATCQWQLELAQSFNRVEDFLAFVELDSGQISDLGLITANFPFKVTRHYAAKMRKGDPCDPLLLQVLPTIDEHSRQDSFIPDPVGDLPALIAPGLIHKYQGRVLLVSTGACAIHCRYCFRREFPYHEYQLTRQRERAAVEYIAADQGIEEVILSGGDPLILNDQRIQELFMTLSKIPHIKRLRIHSRFPVILPSRITDTLTDIFGQSQLKLVFVIHTNHANELDSNVGQALARLTQAGITLLNQAVLLRGVNDTATAQCALSKALFEYGVLPYYLHLLDKVTGTQHFDVSETEALGLHRAMQTQLPGYLVPRLVREEAGLAYKRLV